MWDASGTVLLSLGLAMGYGRVLAGYSMPPPHACRRPTRTAAAPLRSLWPPRSALSFQWPGQRSKKFHELWPDIIIHYVEDYPDICRLVMIALLIPVDTSECERIFSLMNNLKTAQRSRLGNNLKNLMAWHTVAKNSLVRRCLSWTSWQSSALSPGSAGAMRTAGRIRRNMTTE